MINQIKKLDVGNRVLVVRLSSLGDIVLTQPLVEQIHKSGAKVDLLLYPDYASLGKLLPGVDRVITSKADLDKRYALVLDLHGTLRARQMLSNLKIQRLVRYNKRPLQRRLRVRWQGWRMPWNILSGLHPDEQVIRWYAEAGQRAGYPIRIIEPRLEISEWVAKAADQILTAYAITPETRFAVYAPGAKWRNKEWPIEYFISAAEKIRVAMGLLPVFVGSNMERTKCEQAAKACTHGISLVGRTNISTLAAILQRADLLIANDSGPMHLGLAAGTKTLAVFGPTVSEFGFMPIQHPLAKVFSVPLTCRPCSLHGGHVCPLKHHACLRSIQPETLVQTAIEWVGAKPRVRNSL